MSFTAKDIAEKFQSRETRSVTILNQLTEEKKVVLVKIATPTRFIFFISRHLRAKNYPLTQNVYESLAAVAAEKPFFF